MGRNRCSEERQAQIYEVIRDFLMEKGYPPSVREIGKIVGLKSSSTVHGYLSQLEEAGKIKRDPTKPRAIDLVEDQAWKRTLTIPLVKKLTSGKPADDEDNVLEYIAVPTAFLRVGDHLFMMKAPNDDLASSGISKGDLLLVRMQKLVKDRDIVVAIVEGSMNAVVRLCSKERGGGLLINDAGASSLLRTSEIFGKVLSVYHIF